MSQLMIDLMKAFGFDRIFLETVGAGQADTAVRAVADTVVARPSAANGR